MGSKTAKASVAPVRQTTQYNCMAASMGMALRACGVSPGECTTDIVNKVMGARPMKGAAWEQALACAQHYGVRGTLVCPSTVSQLKEWCDAGKPVMIAWNPEGREWSHASVVFDVTEDPEHGLMVHVADPNIPDPEETVRVVPKGEFYQKWYEKWPNYLVRRPALMLDREITQDGRQVMAGMRKIAEEYDRMRDRALERDTWRQRAPMPSQSPAKLNLSEKVVAEKKDSVNTGGMEVRIKGRQQANGFISVDLSYPVSRLIGSEPNPVQEEIFRLMRSDSSWSAQGKNVARRRYWLKGSPDQHGGWPEVRSLDQALSDVKKLLSAIDHNITADGRQVTASRKKVKNLRTIRPAYRSIRRTPSAKRVATLFANGH